jgi:hypothetical protein
VNQKSASVTRAVLDDLKSKQIAFLHARLVSPAARAEWRANFAAVLDELLDQPVGQIVDANAVTSVIDAMLAKAVLDTSLRPALLRLAREVRAMLVAEEAQIGTFVPPSAQKALRDLASRPNRLTEQLVREVSEHEAARLVMADVLHDALVQFSDRVNPFAADWGLPSLLKRFAPFGLGGVGKSVDGMRAEFERRLEPEIRKFLTSFSREALRKGSGSIISQAEAPAFIALRQQIVDFLLAQRFADVLLDEADTDIVTQAAVDVIVHVCTDDKLAQRRRRMVKAFVDAHAQASVRSVLVAFGLPDKPPALLIDAISDATFPAFAAGLGTQAGKRWLEGLVAEFYDGLVALDEGTGG